MFLKVSKTPHTIRCHKGNERKTLQIGVKYGFSLVKSCRNGKKIGHKTIANLGSITVDEYEPLHRGGGTSDFGTACIWVYVKSFNLDDPESFRKVQPKPAVRFYHTFSRNLSAAAYSYDIPLDKLREIVARITQIIPLYSIDDYRAYMKEAVEEKIRQEASGGYRKDLGKMIGRQTPFEAYDYVQLQDGLLQGYRNKIMVEIKYDFELY